MKTIRTLLMLICCHVATFFACPSYAATTYNIYVHNNGGTSIDAIAKNVNGQLGVGWDNSLINVGVGASVQVAQYYFYGGSAGTFEVWKRPASSGSPTWFTTQTLPTSNPGGSVTWTVEAVQSDPTTNLCSMTLSARNADVVPHVYSLYQNGAEYDPGGGQLAAYPGQTVTARWTVPCTNAYGWSLDYAIADIQFGYNPLGNITNATIVTNGTYANASQTNDIRWSNPNTYQGGVTTNIVFSSSANTNTILSQQQGDSGIKQAVDANTLATGKALSELGDRIVGALDGQTNGTDMSGVTNLLGRILTNIMNTNFTASDTLTNYDAATAAGTEASSEATDKAEEFMEGIGDAPGGALNSAGSSAAFTMEFAGQTINLDPEVQFPGVMGMAKTLMTAIVLILFATNVSKLFYDLTTAYTTAQTGGIPNINAGVNVGGIAIAPIISAAVIATWVAGIVVFLTLVISHLTGFIGAMTAAAGIALPEGTQYLLYASTPVNLILSLAFTRIALWVAAGKIVLVAGSISRFLVGK